MNLFTGGLLPKYAFIPIHRNLWKFKNKSNKKKKKIEYVSRCHARRIKTTHLQFGLKGRVITKLYEKNRKNILTLVITI